MKKKIRFRLFTGEVTRWMLLLLFWVGTSMTALAQQTTVKGTVLDSTGEPVIGASIKEKGTNTGTVTDLDGNFSLSVSGKKPVLVVSYVGYTTQEIAVSGQKALKITLKEDAGLLDEVVVVGYGVQKKATLSGSVTQVKGDIV